MFSGTWPRMTKAGITVKQSTRKSQLSLIQHFFSQLVIDHTVYISIAKPYVLFILTHSFLKMWSTIWVIVLTPPLKNTPKCLNHTTVVAFVQLANKTCVMVPEMDWNFVQHPANMTVKQGENVTVVCRPPCSRPTAQVSWFKNNQLYIPTNHVAVLPSGDLFFQRCVSLKATYNFPHLQLIVRKIGEYMHMFLHKSLHLFVCVCVCVLMLCSVASKNKTVGATSAELQTFTFNDFSPLKGRCSPWTVTVILCSLIHHQQYLFLLPGSSSISQGMAQSCDGAPGSSSKARVSSIWSPFAHCKLAEKRPLQTNRRQDCSWVS